MYKKRNIPLEEQKIPTQNDIQYNKDMTSLSSGAGEFIDIFEEGYEKGALETKNMEKWFFVEDLDLPLNMQNNIVFQLDNEEIDFGYYWENESENWFYFVGLKNGEVYFKKVIKWLPILD